MFCIDKNNKITLTKGDTATMLVEVYDLDKKKYEIKSTDVVTFTMRRTAAASTALITKIADSEHFIILNSADTVNLDSGLYVYDVQLVTADGYTYTVVPTSYFQLTNEVTR